MGFVGALLAAPGWHHLMSVGANLVSARFGGGYGGFDDRVFSVLGEGREGGGMLNLMNITVFLK
jgi:hypothetical protein